MQRGRRLRDLIRYPNGEKVGAFHIPTSLEDYRTAYRAYLTDPDLQDARARWPFVCVWDNHEFSWQGWQSQQVYGGETRPGQTKKVAANQAWWEYQPGRVRQPAGYNLDRFQAPRVRDTPVASFDASGLGNEPNNLAAIGSLTIYRSLRWGSHVDLILTDNHSYRSRPPDDAAITPADYRWMQPQEAVEILDWGRAWHGGSPPATIRFGGSDVPNSAREAAPQSHLGAVQKAWFLDRLRRSTAAWKIWGHSFGTLVWRTDIQNLPQWSGPAWPGAGYGLLNGGFFAERAEICDLVRREGITGFAVVAGDKHSFWAGPGLEGSSAGQFRSGRRRIRHRLDLVTGPVRGGRADHPARRPPPSALSARSPDGTVAPAINMTVLHGARASFELQRSNNLARALAMSNPQVAPHLRFADLGGHGFATVLATADALETEFVCIPRPAEPSGAADGGRSAIGSSTASHAGRGASGRGSSSRSSKGRRLWRRRKPRRLIQRSAASVHRQVRISGRDRP
jgi:alkaline phosphatase D